MCFHKYEKINKKVYTTKKISFYTEEYDIYDLYKCKKCGKIEYNLICTHDTYTINQSIDFERKLKDLDIQNNMDYILSN